MVPHCVPSQAWLRGSSGPSRRIAGGTGGRRPEPRHGLGGAGDRQGLAQPSWSPPAPAARPLAHADVLVQNLQPGQAEAVGLGAAAILEANPQLVYASIGAFGVAGPLR